MKKLLILSYFITLMVIFNSCKKDPESIFSYAIYPSYSIQSQHYIPYSEEFLIINDSASFNEVFKLDETITNPMKISSSDFNDKVVISVLKENRTACECAEYTIESVDLIGKKLIFKYRSSFITPNPGPSSCDMMCRANLLITVDKNRFATIDFYQNGVFKKTISN